MDGSLKYRSAGILLMWMLMYLSAPLSFVFAEGEGCGENCSLRNPSCICSSEGMDEACPAMKAEAHPLVLILPSAPVNHYLNDEPLPENGPVHSGDADFNRGDIADQQVCILKDRSSPPAHENDLHIIFLSLLI